MALECMKCCCCIPLRRGLLIWAYLRLIVDFIYVILCISNEISEFMVVKTQIANFIAMFIISLLDIPVTIIFIFGAHKKNPILLKVYFYHLLVVTVLQTLLSIVVTGFAGAGHLDEEEEDSNDYGRSSFEYRDGRFVLDDGRKQKPSVLSFVIQEIVSILISLAIQIYFALMVRSEYLKLERNSKNQYARNPEYAAPGAPVPTVGYTPAQGVYGVTTQ